MTTYTFPAGSAITVTSVGDGGVSIDTTLAAAAGVTATVYADSAGTTELDVLDLNGLPTTVTTTQDGFFSAFTVEDYPIVYLAFGDLPPMPHYSVEQANAVATAESASTSAESAAEAAIDAKNAAELAADSLADATAGAVRASDGTRVPLTVVYEDDPAPTGYPDGSFFLVGLRSLPEDA